MKLRALFAGLGALALLAGGAYLNRERLVLAFLGAKLEKRTLAEQQALIEPFIHVFEPTAGDAPFPAVVQFHGCAGYRQDFMAQWAKIATDLGFIVIAVDSNGARGIDREAALSSVCAGKALIGQERAGDIAAALAIVAGRDDVDASRIVGAAWSHGAWSLMDYIALTSGRNSPPSLRGKSQEVDLAGAALFYPYCGEGTWSRIERWKTPAKVIAFIGGKDTIVDGAECKTQIEKIAATGVAVDLVYYPDADHVFDDATLIGGEYEHFYDAPAHADAAARYRAFLETLKGRP